MMAIGGWIFDIDVIKAPLNRVPIPFVAALSFFSTGISLYLLSRFYEGKQSIGIIVIPICLLVVFLFMITSLASLFFNVHTGIETAIENIVTKNENVNTIIPSARPPVIASVMFILSASAQTSVISGYVRSNKFLQISGIIIMALASVAIIGHILNQPNLFRLVPWSNGIPTHGAVGFEIIGMSLILLGKIGYKQNIRIETNTIKTRLIFLFIGFMVAAISFFSFWSYDVAITPRPLQEVTYTIAIMTSVILLTVSVYVIIISRSISSGITKLMNVSKEIKKGKQDVKADTNSNDEIGYLGKSFNDMIEEIKKNEEKLREIDVLKEEFAAMVSHELKTPLIPISGYAELFLDGSLGNITELQREKMQVMYENSIRLTTLIQDILDARKVELKRLNLNIQVESIKEIAKRCIDIFRPIAEPKGIRLVDETQDIMIKCDPERILQVFNNVISNALKFVPAQYGTISINSRIDNDTVMISIKDNGIGIPKQKQEDLFKKFYQVDKTLTRKSGGTGLGLAISRGIIEAHGGKIWVESEENQGTTVHFTIQKGDSN